MKLNIFPDLVPKNGHIKKCGALKRSHFKALCQNNSDWLSQVRRWCKAASCWMTLNLKVAVWGKVLNLMSYSNVWSMNCSFCLLLHYVVHLSIHSFASYLAHCCSGMEPQSVSETFQLKILLKWKLYQYFSKLVIALYRKNQIEVHYNDLFSLLCITFNEIFHVFINLHVIKLLKGHTSHCYVLFVLTLGHHQCNIFALTINKMSSKGKHVCSLSLREKVEEPLT